MSDQSQRALVSLPEDFLEMSETERLALLAYLLRNIRRLPSSVDDKDLVGSDPD